jgi:outer membrane autotransporter protein
VFSIARLGEAGFVSAEVTGAAFDQRYAQSLCLQSNSGGIFNVAGIFSGTLKGSPEGYRTEAQLRAGYDLLAGPLLVGPRVGLDYSWTKVDAYSESEASARGSSILTPNPLPTGAALRYRDQDFTSLQSRLGLIVALPIALSGSIITPLVEGTYIHEFENGQRDIEASFVEDFRPNPAVFSFKTDAPDRDFFELGGGVNAQLGEGSEVFVGGKSVLNNSLFDSYSIQVALRLRF